MFKEGDTVLDDLTGTIATVVRISTDAQGNVGYWLDNEWLGGGRHPWEISPRCPPQLQMVKGGEE